jgi:hypothetical protein
VARGEKPIELGVSWLSAKSIEVERTDSPRWGRVPPRDGRPPVVPTLAYLPIRLGHAVQTDAGCKGPASKGKQPRSPAKVPKRSLSGKGRRAVMTPRKSAWKQPSYNECVRAHWARRHDADNVRSSRDSPTRRHGSGRPEPWPPGHRG